MLNCLLFSRNFYSFISKNRSMSSSIAYFKLLKDEEKLNITLNYKNSELKVDKTLTFNRNLTEKIVNFIPRIKGNLEKELNKKNKKRKKKDEADESQSEAPEITVQFLDSGNLLEEQSFSDLLKDFEERTGDFELKILETHYTVLYNHPCISTIALPNSILAGFYVYPAKLEFQYAEKAASEFNWFKGKMPESKREDQIEWKEIGSGFTYLVQSEDIGYKLKIECTPKSLEKCGVTEIAISKNIIEAGPGVCPFEVRHLFTEEKLSGREFRVVTYNLLADYYADSEYSRTMLFPYCPPYALDIDYRKQLFLKEILGYNADIICLQEVDGKIFDLDLVPFLEARYLSGVHMKKGTTPEGLAIFYDTNRFDFIEKYGINIGENIKILPEFKDLYEKIKTNEKLMERITDRSTSLQAVLLKSKDTGKFLLVANTHLYFHPNADHIRLLQGGFCILFLQNLVDTIKFVEKLDENDIGLIFCGDFNSVPSCGIYKLFTEKFVGDECVDFCSFEEEAVKDVCLTQEFNLKSACGTPQYTNYTPGFAECIDYIYYQTDTFEVKEAVPFPTDEEVKAHIAIPSVVFPSDHLASVANLKWK